MAKPRKYPPKPAKHRIGYETWRVVHQWKKYPGRNSAIARKGPYSGMVNYNHKVIYIRQYRQGEWDRLNTIIHESLHAASRQSSEEWVGMVADQISGLIGHYFEIRNRKA